MRAVIEVVEYSKSLMTLAEASWWEFAPMVVLAVGLEGIAGRAVGTVYVLVSSKRHRHFEMEAQNSSPCL